MISIRHPDPEQVRKLVDRVAQSPFSYSHVGRTRNTPPEGFNVDRYSIELGVGDEVWAAAKSAINNWVPFRLSWIKSYPQGEPEPDVAVAVVARILGFWWVNISRVVYTIDEADLFGFAYGTLGYHAEIGEECFMIQRDPNTGTVTYSILAFSKPGHVLARLGYPLSRAAQRRFGAGSLKAMFDAIETHLLPGTLRESQRTVPPCE